VGLPLHPARRTLNVAVYFPTGARVLAEVVSRPEEIYRGLMYRQVVSEGTGMLFDMGSVAQHRFWMKDTLVPLDMLFLDPGMTVVGIVESATPYDHTLRGVKAPSRYVLEVPGGWCARHGVRTGQRVEVVRLPG
jgi:uncharacterized protein